MSPIAKRSTANTGFPVYTKGDGILHFSGGSGYLSQDVHIREFVKYTDYRQFKSTVKITYDGQDVGKDPAQPNGGAQPAPQQPPPPK